MINLLLNNLNSSNLIILPLDSLKNLLTSFEILREEETYFSDKIRVLKSANQYLIQEKSKKQEIILRRVDSEQAANDFIDKRLALYENMWNGCGCKINYYD